MNRHHRPPPVRVAEESVAPPLPHDLKSQVAKDFENPAGRKAASGSWEVDFDALEADELEFGGHVFGRGFEVESYGLADPPFELVP